MDVVYRVILPDGEEHFFASRDAAIASLKLTYANIGHLSEVPPLNLMVMKPFDDGQDAAIIRLSRHPVYENPNHL